MRSRSGSMAGFVTCANAWRRWSAMGRSRRPRPGVGVSSPMLQSGSWPSSAIVLMSSRARSASRPDRWRSWTSSGTDSWARLAAASSARSSWIGRGASWIGSARSARVLASASSRIARRPGSTSSSSPGTETPTPDRVLRGEGDGASLGRHRDQSIACHGERRRSQAVAVDHRAHADAVREDDRRGSVPRGEEPGGPAPQRGDVRMRRAPERERFGDRGQEGGGQVPAGGHQQFEGLVE